MSIAELSHDDLEKRIEEYHEEIPMCNPLQRDVLRDTMRDCYKRLIKEGRYNNRLLGEIVRLRNSGFSWPFAADVLSTDDVCIRNVKATGSDAEMAKKALVKLIKDLYSLVDKEDMNGELHLKRIGELVKDGQ